jgi:hypothetical protein
MDIQKHVMNCMHNAEVWARKSLDSFTQYKELTKTNYTFAKEVLDVSHSAHETAMSWLGHAKDYSVFFDDRTKGRVKMCELLLNDYTSIEQSTMHFIKLISG